mmetsp:Transcript_42119/g.111285  ORF Transcript_42119/g.111285 Transcript_42119/m.111285 type:complete len:890 (-) Transcript_42119:142-2811(-)
MEMTMQRVNSKTPNLDAVTALSRTLTLVRLSEDPEEARVKYVKLRQAVRELFEIFLRNLNLKSLHALEQQFNSKGDLQIGDFLRVFMRVFPQPDPLVWTDRGERLFIVQLAIRLLFESMDVDNGGEVSWQEFVEFVCAIAEELRLKAAEESGQTFEFHTSKVVAPFKPYVTRCVFDQVYYWPEHPSDSAIIFEEGQTGFNLHRPSNMQRKRRVDGHSGELLAAVYMPAPYEWVVTSANDKTICFWDSTFMLIKKWSLDQVMGALCWCHEIGVLYAAEHFTEKFRAWRINDPLSMRACEGALKPDKTYNLSNASGHTKAVQSICWLGNMTSLATASLDGKVVIYDLVLKKRAHVLTNHKKGVCFLAFCPKNHMLLSGGFDSFICIWDPGAGILTHMLEEHDCSLAGLCYVPATDYEFVSVDFDGMVKHWDVRRLVCLQSWSASDKVAEKAGDLEALDPRAICALGPNRILITGRRMVVFDRDCIDPHVTTDWPINAIAFNQTRIEIVTPIKNDIYVWCALTGELLTVHDNLTEGMITAVTLGLGERRFFLGADDGQIQVVNYACGAKLKVLTPHTCEVTQIECIPEKVVTLSTAEKLIMVHDDNDPIKSVVLKRIDVSSAGSIIQMAMDHAHGIIAAATEDGEVVWLSSEFAKQVSDSESCVVQHNTAVGCVRYFEKAPLMVTADAEASVIFWSVPPLRTYDFFRKVTIRGCAKSRTITSLNMDPDEELLYVGLDSGELYAVGISQFCAIAKQQEADVKRLKKAGMRQDLIFDSMPKPIDSPDYVFELDAMWCVDKAHKGMIDTIIVCKRRVPVVLTLGTDQCVRIWGYDSGDALGTVEQGLPEGLAWERLSPWRFPMDALEELEQDKQAVLSALEDGIEEEDDDDAENE